METQDGINIPQSPNQDNADRPFSGLLKKPIAVDYALVSNRQRLFFNGLLGSLTTGCESRLIGLAWPPDALPPS